MGLSAYCYHLKFLGAPLTYRAGHEQGGGCLRTQRNNRAAGLHRAGCVRFVKVAGTGTNHAHVHRLREGRTLLNVQPQKNKDEE